VDIDFEKDPIAVSPVTGKQIFLRDIWPSQAEIDTISRQVLVPEVFSNVYKNVLEGNSEWDAIKTSKGDLYEWDNDSTYIRQPPYFDNASLEPQPLKDVLNARCLLYLGDSVTTDHISPAGSIAKTSPAAKMLSDQGVQEADFSIYGCRRGNHEIMMRGTFAHVRLINKMADSIGPKAVHVPSGDVGSVYDVAMRYKNEGRDAIILAGKEYGTGSSRDWAAKGVQLQGVRAVIAESYERIHRSNLVGMGVLPLQFQPGHSAESMGLTGHEQFSIPGVADIKPGSTVTVKVTREDGSSFDFHAIARIDTDVEKEYFAHGGVLLYVMRQIVNRNKSV
jgi:aconitate hydratase